MAATGEAGAGSESRPGAGSGEGSGEGPAAPRDHGGNLDAARARWGGTDWIDLSTGINRVPYPVAPPAPSAWRDLPTPTARRALIAAAAAAWGCAAPMAALAGAQAAIQLLPRLAAGARGGRLRAAVLGPTYNEYAATLSHSGAEVIAARTPEALAGADLAVIVNPNNPDGRRHDPRMLLGLAGGVGQLVVDESFADPTPELSLLPSLSGAVGEPLVLRSFGKFYGLAGLRLGFAAGPAALIARIEAEAGPWPVSGPAIEIGARALTDRDWAAAAAARLAAETARLDALAKGAGWARAGGTALFRLYDTPDAEAAQDRLARARIWSRIFPWHPRWLRLGLPGSAGEWARLAAALGDAAR